jgi:SAM-dependent methyltransferase
MSATEYAKFYQTGTYRRLVSAYHGREMGGNEKQYARHVAAFVRGYGIQTRLCSILDIGGAPDGLWGWWERCTIAQRERIIDPAIDGETAETFDARGETWDLILVAQTVDHLLEPGAVFKKLAGCLAPAGILFFDAVDWDATKEYKIDHPCNFNMRSASMLAEVAGLRIDKMERSGNHLRFLCRHW